MKLNREKSKKILMLYTLIIFVGATLILPLFSLFKEAFYLDGIFVGFENFKEYFSSPILFKSALNSITVSSITSLIVVFLAFIFAYGLERSNIKYKKALRFIAILPIFMPTMTHAIALIYLLGENGILTTGFLGAIPFLSFDFPLYGMWGVVLGELFYVFPAVFMMFSVAFKSCDFRLYEVADTLNTSSIKKFFTITIPSVRYTMISAFLASFTMVFSDFGIPKVLGGNFSLLSTDVYKQVIGQSNITMGATVGILLIIPSIISFIVDLKASKKEISLDSKATDFRIRESNSRDIMLSIICYAVSLVIMLMIVAVFLAAFTKQWPYNLSFTLEWFNLSSSGISIWSIYFNTVFVAIMSAIIGTIISLLIAYVTQRFTGFSKARKVLDLLTMIPLAIPGLLVGLSYLLFFNKATNPLNFIYGSFIILVLANVIHFMSVPYITMKGRMKKIESEYESVGETLGASWTTIFGDVILPLSKYSILESFSYMFLNSMMTISAIVFLYAPKTKVAAVEMLAKYDEGFLASTAAIAILILVTNVVVKYGIEYFINKKEKVKQ